MLAKGKCLVNYSGENPDQPKKIVLNHEENFHVKKNCWHQITNPYNSPCHIIEIQYGDKTSEDDIERLYYYEGNE